MLKIDHYGISRRNLQWIRKYLNNRTERVAVFGDTLSVPALISGVPQGTLLGLLLFLIYINNMPSLASSAISVFANDAYIYRSIRNTDNCKILQEDLEKLKTLEQSWSMGFHQDKSRFELAIYESQFGNQLYLFADHFKHFFRAIVNENLCSVRKFLFKFPSRHISVYLKIHKATL